MLQQAMTMVLQALLSLAVAAVAAGAARAAQWLRGHVRSQKLQRAIQIGGIVVSAVEQAAAAGLISLPKKEAAAERLREWAKREGLQLTDEQVNDIIEAAVKALKDAGNELKTGLGDTEKEAAATDGGQS